MLLLEAVHTHVLEGIVERIVVYLLEQILVLRAQALQISELSPLVLPQLVKHGPTVRLLEAVPISVLQGLVERIVV